jgi:hypothetical protein
VESAKVSYRLKVWVDPRLSPGYAICPDSVTASKPSPDQRIGNVKKGTINNVLVYPIAGNEWKGKIRLGL